MTTHSLWQLPMRILPLVVLQELAALERTPPRLIVLIPIDSRCQAAFERNARNPSELANLCAIDRVPAVVPFTIDNMAHVRFHRSAASLNQAPRNLYIRLRISAADVV